MHGNVEDDEHCNVPADEMHEQNSVAVNEKSFSNQTNYYIGNPTQMPGGDDDDIIEDEPLFENEEEESQQNFKPNKTIDILNEQTHQINLSVEHQGRKKSKERSNPAQQK